MKLASLKSDDRDGALMIVSRDLTSMCDASSVSPNLRHAIEHWTDSFPLLTKLAGDLEDGILQTEPYDPTRLSSPLPRSFQWADGSAYLSHMRLVRKARGAEMPPNSEIEPLLYQGGSDYFLGPTDDIICPDTSWGLDFESEIAIITDDVPMGC
ncbi:MAG: fumarylacetoacetate hydrolase family protein, partial [Litorivicinaceae bacterium]